MVFTEGGMNQDLKGLVNRTGDVVSSLFTKDLWVTYSQCIETQVG